MTIDIYIAVLQTQSVPSANWTGFCELDDLQLLIFHCRFSQTLQMVLAAGEDQKVHQGLFENYLEAKVKDPRLDKVCLNVNILFCYSFKVYSLDFPSISRVTHSS
jgi:hypothetical protein